jgi:general secretion pathway protein L
MNTYLYDTQNAKALLWNEEGLRQLDGDSLALDGQVILLGNTASTVKVEMPIKQAKQIAKALPFALEDKLATEVEENHIVYLGSKSGSAHALIIEHDEMERLVELGVNSATSFSSVLPNEKGRITLAIFQDRAYIKTDEFYSVCIPLKLLSFTLEQLRKDEVIGDNINLIELTELDELQKAELTNLGFNVQEQSYGDAFEIIRNGFNKSINLFTGIYKPKTIKTNKKPFKFKTPVALAASLLIATLMGLSLQTGQLESKAEAVKQASINYYKKLFPGERVRERAFKRQFRDSVGDSSSSLGGGSFTTLLANSTSKIKNNAKLELDAVRFNKSKSTLELSLIANSVGDLEKLKTELMDKALSVEIASANQSGGKIKGLLKVKSNG